MSTLPIVTAGGEPAAAYADREARLQRALIAYIVVGLLFMLLPGTFLGVWNLISAAGQRDPASLRPAWLQAHGHAQIFGWIGTFILGIGFYSLSKMGQLPAYAVTRAWWAFALWTIGVFGRWFAGVSEWQWQVLLPASSALELAAFLIFFRTVSGHRTSTAGPRKAPEAWMLMVIASTLGFLFSLTLNLAATLQISWLGSGPALPHASGQMLVALQTWGFLVPAIWGFNARWLPVFLGLGAPRVALLFTALAAAWISLLAGFFHQSAISAMMLPVAALCSIAGLRVWERAVQPAKTQGVHRSFPHFVRFAYVWLLVAAGLWVWAAWDDRNGGIWGAARHALTVGFISTMVFSIGQRILPAFGGARVLYSPRLMLLSLLTLSVGCTLRVTSEIAAYEEYWSGAWTLLPLSALLEIGAVSLFATNLIMTFAQPPAHLRSVTAG